MDDRQIGARIAYWRERRGVTQKLLADRIGRSKSWIEKVEAGKRSADRLPMLLTICQELRIDLPVLIGRELTRDTRQCIDDIQVEMIRGALERYDAIRNDIPVDYTPDVPKVRRQLAYVWSAFELADYQVVSRTLPGLLLEAQRCNVTQDNAETKRILAEVYQITASTLRNLGEYDLAWLAGDRGMSLAEHTDDIMMPALTGFRVANALVAIGRSGAAFDLNISLASRLESSLRTEANCRPVARGTIENLIERSRGKPSSALRSLAERAGVTT
jgi:transcriptional regulator with XRE-family HTH domain